MATAKIALEKKITPQGKNSNVRAEVYGQEHVFWAAQFANRGKSKGDPGGGRNILRKEQC